MKQYFFPLYIKQKMLIWNWSDEDVCKMANVSKTELQKFFNQDTSLKADTLFKLAKFMDYKVYDLLYPNEIEVDHELFFWTSIPDVLEELENKKNNQKK